ncbi:MAG: hypothetical protein QW666_02850 [Candidatus Woesearchaeota archaeon]
MQKEREEITEIEKEEKLEVPAEEAAPALDKILSASTIFLYSNSTDFQIPGYYQFSQGVYLRLVLHPGFKKIIIKTEKEFFEWNAYVDTLMRIAQSKFVGKNWACGTWQKDFNYFAFTFGAGTDHVGRSAFATIALVYPAQFEPQMKKICENNKKRIELQNMLKNIIQSKR